MNKEEQSFSQNPQEDLESLKRYIQEYSLFLPLAVYSINPVGLIVNVNKAGENLSGYKKEMELIGKDIDILFKDKEAIEKLFDQTLKKGSIKNKEMILMTKNGKETPVRIATSIRKGPEKNTIGCFFALNDITEIKKSQTKIEERTEKLKKTKDKLAKTLEKTQEAKKRADNEKNKTSAIISNLVDPIIIINPNNKISLFNPKAKEIFGFSKSDIGKKVDKSNYHSMENFKKVIDKDYQVIKGKDTEPKNLQEEELNIEYEGSTLTYKIITTKVHDNKKRSLGTMKIFSDLTREKRINRLKTEFVSIAAHQLRTPLSAIKWVLKMVLQEDTGPLNEEQEDALRKGFESNERMIKLVNDMLNVSRIEEGRFEFNFAKTNFKEVYETVTNNLKNKVKEKGIKFNIKKPTKMPSVYVDKERIRLVIQNLLDNAIKYTPNNGTVTLEIKKLKDKLKIRIKDNGVGIPQKDQQRLFTKFFRAENVKKMQTDGNGLGLFIANNIVKKHNSKIYFKSTEGRGTEFYFYLPLNKNKEN